MRPGARLAFIRRLPGSHVPFTSAPSAALIVERAWTGQSERTVVELNGTPLNGSRVHLSHAPVEWAQETSLVWLPTSGSWPSLAMDRAEPVADEFDAERSRLEAEIADAKARAVAARQRAAEREAQMRAALQAEIAASREQLSVLEREHDATVARIRAAAQAEVEQILAEARRQAGRDADTIDAHPRSTDVA
jgi:hypothetical protein